MPPVAEARVPDPGSARPIATRGDDQVLYARTGLYPIVANNEESRNLAHRAAPGVVRCLLRRSRRSGTTSGRLTTLLASGLAIFFALSLVAQARRAAIAAASQEVATVAPSPDPPPALSARPVVAPLRGDRAGR